MKFDPKQNKLCSCRETMMTFSPPPRFFRTQCTAGGRPGGGVSGECTGDPSGGRAAADLSRGSAESHHLQSHSKMMMHHFGMDNS